MDRSIPRPPNGWEASRSTAFSKVFRAGGCTDRVFVVKTPGWSAIQVTQGTAATPLKPHVPIQSSRYPLDLIERNLVPGAIVGLRRARARVHGLSVFQRASGFEIWR